MAALTITAADVGLKSDRSRTRNGTLGEAVTPGQAVYLNSSDSKYYLCDADDSTKVAVAGITLTGGAANETFVMAYSGPVDMGATLTVGEIYIIGATAGAVHPVGDFGANWYGSIVGIAEDASTLWLTPTESKAARP